MSAGRFRWTRAALILAFCWLSGATAARADADRIAFRVSTIEESPGRREVVSDARIEGPPGTDFRILLDSARFEMQAHFLTDLLDRGRIKVRARIETRRLYGRSGRGLPLYEEDRQDHAIEMSFDEALVLLPFGGEDLGERLKVEILPQTGRSSPLLPDGTPRPLEIDIVRPSPGGVVRIEAEKIPHRFEVEAVVRQGPRVLAAGSGELSLQERGELELAPLPGDSPALDRYALELTVDGFARSHPQDRVSFRFDLAEVDGGEGILARNWAGMTLLGEEVSYRLSTETTPDDDTLELELRLRVARETRP